MLDPLLPDDPLEEPLLPDVPLVSDPVEPVVPVDPLVPPVVPLIPPLLPVVPVPMSMPPSRAVALGGVAPRRPSGELAFVLLPPPPLFVHAPTPASIAAAEAKVIHLRSVIVSSPGRSTDET